MEIPLGRYMRTVKLFASWRFKIWTFAETNVKWRKKKSLSKFKSKIF